MADDRSKHDDGKLLYCSFCGKSQHEVRKLIAGPSVFVCDECVELCNDIIREELEEKQERSRDRLPKPHEIRKVLDENVIGQDRAKKILAVAVYNHYKRLQARPGDKRHRHDKDEVELEGNLTGRSGTCPSISFSLSGTPVVTNSSTEFKDGSCSSLANGQRVEVKGTRQGDGSVLARRVEKDD